MRIRQLRQQLGFISKVPCEGDAKKACPREGRRSVMFKFLRTVAQAVSRPEYYSLGMIL